MLCKYLRLCENAQPGRRGYAYPRTQEDAPDAPEGAEVLGTTLVGC